MATRTPADFDTFYAQTSQRVLQHVYAVCGNLAEAQDVVQESYARAWQRWATVSQYDRPEAWVRTVAWRLAANRWRGLRRWLGACVRLGRPAVAVGPTPDRVAVIDALRRIPRVQREAVVLHYLLDLPVAEIAAITGAPIGTIKVRLARARAALAPLLRDLDKEIARVPA
jgi:RNA polymerase sigma-70 factor (ECF subfamily)